MKGTIKEYGQRYVWMKWTSSSRWLGICLWRMCLALATCSLSSLLLLLPDYHEVRNFVLTCCSTMTLPHHNSEASHGVNPLKVWVKNKPFVHLSNNYVFVTDSNDKSNGTYASLESSFCAVSRKFNTTKCIFNSSLLNPGFHHSFRTSLSYLIEPIHVRVFGGTSQNSLSFKVVLLPLWSMIFSNISPSFIDLI